MGEPQPFENSLSNKSPQESIRLEAQPFASSLSNLFDTEEEASNAINEFYEGSTDSLSFSSPRVTRPRITSTISQKETPEFSSSSSDVSEVQIRIKLFDPFVYAKNL